MAVKQKLPAYDDPRFEPLFRQLCEAYADESDCAGKGRKARDNLLAFCKAYAYKVNNIVSW